MKALHQHECARTTAQLQHACARTTAQLQHACARTTAQLQHACTRTVGARGDGVDAGCDGERLRGKLDVRVGDSTDVCSAM